MSDVRDTDPAFPTHCAISNHDCLDGMSLRDYFAATAMHNIALVAVVSGDADLLASYAKTSYLIADAMLAERAKGRN